MKINKKQKTISRNLYRTHRLKLQSMREKKTRNSRIRGTVFLKIKRIKKLMRRKVSLVMMMSISLMKVLKLFRINKKRVRKILKEK
jgi:hypothetical protein